MMELILNNRSFSTIRISLFYANFGKHLNLFNLLLRLLQIKIKLKNTKDLKDIYKKI